MNPVGECKVGWIDAVWPAPLKVRAGTTTRQWPGHSVGPYALANFGDHVGDRPDSVAANRADLSRRLNLPSEPVWLKQVHGCAVWPHAEQSPEGSVADASVTRESGVVLAILTADCLPILLSNRQGTEIAAVHAGWRGLADGVIEATLDRMHSPREQLIAWIGPGIGPSAFEVGDEVRTAMLRGATPDVANDRSAAFIARIDDNEPVPGKWWCDLPALARSRLARAGVGSVSASGLCTHSDPERFPSHRRDRVTGRSASLIWLAPARSASD